jgi:MFS family permease
VSTRCGCRQSLTRSHFLLSRVSASVASIATPFGCLLCGPLLDRFGRRAALLALNVPFVLGWITLALIPSPMFTPLLYLGRILTGVGACSPADSV